VYYTVINTTAIWEHEGNVENEPQVSVFYIPRVFSNMRSVLSQCNTQLRLLHLLYDIEVMWQKTLKHAISMFYTLITRGFLTNQSTRRVLSILQTIINSTTWKYCSVAFIWMVTHYRFKVELPIRQLCRYIRLSMSCKNPIFFITRLNHVYVPWPVF